jgi:predicted lipid-binding transport protein (Tim44 family)
VTTLIVLALVFAFVALRLWAVLGRRTGHEQPIAKAESVPMVRGLSLRRAEPTTPVTSDAAPASAASAAGGLRAISSADPQFDVARFVDGARSAYGMVLEAFWRGDRTALERMVDPHVAQAFGAAIDAREAAGERLDNRLVSIEQAQIEDARVEAGVAHIRIRFDADIAAVTRDKDGAVMAGSLTDAVPTSDVWTFTRPVKSADPNWILTETDEAA